MAQQTYGSVPLRILATALGLAEGQSWAHADGPVTAERYQVVGGSPTKWPMPRVCSRFARRALRSQGYFEIFREAKRTKKQPSKAADAE